MIDKKESQSAKKNVAQNILKNQRFIQKYKSMDNQLQNTIFELQQMGTMEAMQNVMNGLANIMGNAKNKVKVQEFQKSMKTYMTEKERMEAVNEMIQDTMELDEEEIDDMDVNSLINGMEDEVKKKKMNEAELYADNQEEEL